MAKPDPTQPLGSVANPALFDPTSPEFLDSDHTLYAELRQDCPVARFRFAGAGEDPPQTEADRDAEIRSPFVPEVWLTTRYEDGVETLLDDDRFSVDPLTALSPEERAAMPE